jgi:PAS domain S-box-containing protein
VDVSLSAAPLLNHEGRVTGTVAVYVDLTERKRAERELQQACETLEGIFQASPVPIVVHDVNGNIGGWNSACERVFGWRAEEVLGRPNPLLPPDRKDEFWEHREIVACGGRILNKEVVRQRKDGTLVDVSLSVAPLGGREGLFFRSVAVYVDLTERKRAEAELRQAYVTLESIFSASPAAIVVIDSVMKVRAWNRAAERTFGWAAEDVIGQELPIIPTSDRRKALLHRHRLWSGEALSDVEAVARRKDGALIDISISGAPMRDAEGQYTRAVIVYVDVTERKRAQRELREAYETLQTTLRASPAALLTVDQDGNLTAWNEASERMFGWTAEEVLGRPLPIIPGDPETVRRKVQEQMQAGERILNKELKRQRKDGRLLDVSFSMTPFRDASGQIKGALAAYVDLTSVSSWKPSYCSRRNWKASVNWRVGWRMTSIIF